MDYQEAIEYFERRLKLKEKEVLSENPDIKQADDKLRDIYATAISAMQELQNYKQIGTLEDFREAAEKQNAKQPTYDGDGYAPDGTFVWDEWKCPKCGTRYEVDYDDYDYCPNCGQRIDWSEEE